MEQRNLLIAVALSIAILVGFQFLFEPPPPPAPPPAQTSAAPPAPASGAPPVPGTATSTAPAPPTRESALATVSRVRIDTPRLHGSVALAGARLDDLTLARYRETVDPRSPEIVLLSPPSAPSPYYAEFGWVAADPATGVPGPETVWSSAGGELRPGNPVTMTAETSGGLRFTRTLSVDENYMFTVRQTVENGGDAPVRLLPYGLVARIGKPQTAGFFILHEGIVGVLNDTLKEIHYDDLKPGQPVETPTTGGWLGITDKYWLTALIPAQQEAVRTRVTRSDRDGRDRFQVDYLGAERVVPPGGSAEAVNHFFAGAKEVRLLDSYEQSLGIARFDLAIDFGWFYFLTKPIFLTLDFFAGLIGNFGVAILVLTVIIKLLFFPLANKSYAAMSKMKLLQPEMMKLRERFGEDKQRLNQEMMALYKRAGANPLAGCLPIVIQIPVFFALYKVLFVTIEMRHAPFYGWIRDLSAPDPTSIFNLFGLIPWAPPEFLMIGAWPLIMGVTMFLQQKLNPQPADPVQAKVFMALPIIFTFMLASFPAGLVIYWAWNNLLSILQQWVIMRRQGAV